MVNPDLEVIRNQVRELIQPGEINPETNNPRTYKEISRKLGANPREIAATKRQDFLHTGKI